ncbi:hypothetical protein AALP_AA8G437400 [Arabis alpina]|nr:hypothetical protein AALP_AA8G437400 [Arabis alpina]
MFVAKWEPGVVPAKPELSSAPIWLELRQVPFQFFNEEGLEHIASLVGHPKAMHPSTANKTNLEVAKVFTLIDPRKPLPEAVNVRFESGAIARVMVSSPWMPPVCPHSKEVGHSLKRCKLAPPLCSACSSRTHETEKCQKQNNPPLANSPSRRVKAKQKIDAPPLRTPEETSTTMGSSITTVLQLGESTLGNASATAPGESNIWTVVKKKKGASVSQSEVESDSSDINTSNSQKGSEESSDHQEHDQKAIKKTKKKKRESRGKGPNPT